MPDGKARGLSRILHPTMHVGPTPPSMKTDGPALWYDTSADYGILSDTPGALCSLGTGHDVSHNTGVVLNFWVKDRDTHGFWSAGRFTIPPGHGGWYRLRYTFSGEFVSGSGAAGWLWQTLFRKNGTTAIPSGSNQAMAPGVYHGTSGHATVYLNPGEYVEVWANQHAGAGTALRHVGWFSIERMAGIPGPQGPAAPHIEAPGASVRRDTVQSVASGAATPMAWQTVLRDSHGFWSAGQPTRLTIPQGMGGTYLIGTKHFLNATAPGQLLAVFIQKNGGSVERGQVNVIAAAGGGLFVTHTLLLDLLPGDYIESAIYQNVANPYNVGSSATGADSPYLWLIRQVTGVKGDPGGVIERRSDFPSSPYVGQRICRTDIRGGLDFEWNGTYWLSVQEFHWNFGLEALTATAEDRFALDSDLSVYLGRYMLTAYCGPNQDGSNYWTLEFYHANSANTYTIVIQTNTITATDNVWNRLASGVFSPTLIDTSTAFVVGLRATKTLSAGNIWPKLTVTYRLRAT